MIKRSALTLTFSVAMALAAATAAGAQTDCPASPIDDDCVTPVGVLPQNPGTTGNAPTDTGTALPEAPAAVAVSAPRQTLPVTGAETAALALGGLVLVSVGGALVWRSNRASA